MEFERIFGLLFSGFMVKVYGAVMALYIANEAVGFIKATFGSIAF
jgi:hypothetical protein